MHVLDFCSYCPAVFKKENKFYGYLPTDVSQNLIERVTPRSFLNCSLGQGGLNLPPSSLLRSKSLASLQVVTAHLTSSHVLPQLPRAREIKAGLWSVSDKGLCHQGLQIPPQPHHLPFSGTSSMQSYLLFCNHIVRGFSGGLAVKNPPGDSGSIPGLGGSLGEGNGNPFQPSYLGSPRGAWQATVHGLARVRHDLVTKLPPKITL